MATSLSARVQQVKPSPTLAVSARAAALKAEGKDIIGLGTGEPDFDTPDHIKQAAIEAIQAGFTKYTPVDGTPELKQAIINKLERENQLSYQANQILVSTGAKQAIYNLMQALLNPGDEVVIPAPYWVSYPDMALLAEAKPVIVTAGIEQKFKITPGQLDAVMTDKTRLVILNSPSNPTGVAYTKAELAALGAVLKNYPNAIVATDDIYEHIIWADEAFCNVLNACPELYDRTIVFNGVSKAFAMTGWRIGYAAGPADLIAAMKKIQSQSTSNPASISQKASVAALNGSMEPVKAMLTAFKERHDMVYARLSAMEGVSVAPADGTFYIFPNVQKIIDRLDGINNDVEFAEYLLNEVGVALVPGSAFGAEGCIRISFATSMEVLEDALNRIERAIS